MLILILVIIGILMRFLPHAPNFTPVAAIALFGGVYLNKKQSFFLPLALMMLSDVVLGMHNVVLFTWGGFLLVALIGYRAKNNKNIAGIFTASLASSFVFYAVTNFGVWLMGWYPHDLKGLINCYVLGLPFLRTFTAATLLYSAVLFGLFELIARRVKETKLAHVLLGK